MISLCPDFYSRRRGTKLRLVILCSVLGLQRCSGGPAPPGGHRPQVVRSSGQAMVMQGPLASHLAAGSTLGSPRQHPLLSLALGL